MIKMNKPEETREKCDYEEREENREEENREKESLHILSCSLESEN